jgi:hypothetical protein
MNKYLHAIRSSDRTSGVSENFVYTFDSSMTFIHQIRLHNLTIPNAIYNISSTANKLWTRIDRDLGAGWTSWASITITPGAYTTTTLAAAIASALDTLWSDASWTVSFSTTTYMTTISNNQSFLLDIEIDGSSGNSMHTILGYTSAVTPSDSVTGASAYCLSSPYTLHIVIKDQNSNPLNNFASRTGKVRPSFTVPINVNTGEIVQVSKQPPIIIKLLAPRTISSLTVQLKNADDSVVNLLDLEWEMTLEFDQSII